MEIMEDCPKQQLFKSNFLCFSISHRYFLQQAKADCIGQDLSKMLLPGWNLEQLLQRSVVPGPWHTLLFLARALFSALVSVFASSYIVTFSNKVTVLCLFFPFSLFPFFLFKKKNTFKNSNYLDKTKQKIVHPFLSLPTTF